MVGEAPAVAVTWPQLVGIAVAFLVGRAETGSGPAVHCLTFSACDVCPEPVSWYSWLRSHFIAFVVGVVSAFILGFLWLRRANAVNLFFDQRTVNVASAQEEAEVAAPTQGVVATPASLKNRQHGGGPGHA